MLFTNHHLSYSLTESLQKAVERERKRESQALGKRGNVTNTQCYTYTFVYSRDGEGIQVDCLIGLLTYCYCNEEKNSFFLTVRRKYPFCTICEEGVDKTPSIFSVLGNLMETAWSNTLDV